MTPPDAPGPDAPAPAPDLVPVPALVDHLFRRCSVRLVAALTRMFGPARVDLA